ncbi:MAG TPA: enoyl-CoA hydratase-related protein [Actinomycetota bacterium]|nr:enoyl-CoA hydratase-related protein [Actinomycetota bacterium]
MAKILIVDDEPSILQFLKLNLELDGHSTLLAGDGEEALGVIENDKPDLVLLDLMMPILDGWGVLRRVGAMSLTKRPRVIVMTAKGGGPNQARGMALGADDYLTKPLTIDKLRDAVEVVLKRSEEQSEKRRLELLEELSGVAGNLMDGTGEGVPESSRTVTTRHEHGVLWVQLNRPQSLNAFNDEMGGEFLEAMEFAADPAIRCVVIWGEGDGFCSGEDLRALAEDYSAGTDPQLGSIVRKRWIPIITAIQGLEKPVIAAVHGVAAGAGVSLALACDFRIMSDDAKLVLAFSRVGLVPDSGLTWLLPLYLGVGRALQVALRGESISAEQALELGLANQISPKSSVTDFAREMAERLAKGPTAAYGLTKRMMWTAFGTTLAAQMEAEAEAQTAAGRSADHLEGMRAFFEKRPPKFKGR